MQEKTLVEIAERAKPGERGCEENNSGEVAE